MVKCPNCGQKTDGDYCQWCGSPIPRRGSVVRRRTAGAKKEVEEIEKRARKEAERLIKEQAKKEAKEEKKTREAEARAKKEAKEAEKRARKEAEQLAKEQTKKEAEEEKRTREAEARAKKEAEEAEKGARKEAEKVAQDIGSATYKGDFQLVFVSPLGFKQVKQFAERLESIEDLKVLWTGGSVDEGTIIGVSVQKPTPLVRILSEIPGVEKVDTKDGKIVIMLETSA